MYIQCQFIRGTINNIVRIVLWMVPQSVFAVYRRAFSMFDYQKVGEIETDKIRTILITLGNPYDEAELERLIRQEDTEGNIKRDACILVRSAAFAQLFFWWTKHKVT